jgi:signal transduction histidine kinase
VTALAGLAVLGVLAVASVALVLTHRAALTDSLDETLAAQADAVALRLRAGETPERRDLASDDLAVEITRPGGGSAVVSGDLPARLPAGGAAGTGLTTVDLPGDGGRARLLVRDVDGTTVRVVGSLEDVEESAGTLARGLAVAVPLTAGVLAGVLWWALGGALRPVEAIRAEVAAVSADRLDRRVPEPMNAMLDRLEESAARQRRFVADASHELRSPLARMRAELEVDREHPGSADPAGTARSVLDEVDALQRLVDDLLLLAQGDAGAAGPPEEAVDLDEVVGRLAARARAAGPALDTQGVRPVQVRGNPREVERAVGNLLDNAVRHARSRVTVTVVESSGTAVLTVADDGPGIAAADRDRVFERFTRLDEARSSDRGGAGLGLAIARDVAQRHGGDLRLDAGGPRGARFVLTLPVTR